MILLDDKECARIVKELEHEPNLTDWEASFIAGNVGREHFTDKQREVFSKLAKKFQT